MSLRTRFVVALVVLSAAATAAIGAVSYRTTSQQLLARIDESLEETVRGLPLTRGPLGERLGRPAGPGGDPLRGAADLVVQVVGRDGATLSARGPGLPLDDTDLRIAAGDGRTTELRTVEVDGEDHRMLTAGLGDDRGAVQLARSLAETDAVLATLRTRILVAAVLVASVAAAIGWFVARQVTLRLRRLTDAAEQVASTGALEVEVPVDSDDETGRLGGAFNQMLDALARSRRDQQRLVQDAGHELRTPLTSLRTNVFVLRRGGDLSDEQRERTLADLEVETEELSRLVDEVVELALDRAHTEAVTDVDLAGVIEHVAERARSRSGRDITVDADDTVVRGRRRALERAVSNLVENALKFSGDDTVVEITERGGRIEVCDRGPGIDPGEIPHVFERFHRAESARSLPGSGLGLAIVAEVAHLHGGSVHAANRTGGGAVVGFSIPPL